MTMVEPAAASRRLRIGFQVWGQFVSWDDLMEMGQRIDSLGFDSLWSNDHLLPVAGGGPQALELETGPVWDGWMTLAGWAARTERVTLGCLVSSAPFRNPALLVRMAAALDHESRGRAILGLGAGWHAAEHRVFGFPYPSLRGRLDRLDEAARICRRMLDGGAAELEGTWTSSHGARVEPRPMQPRLPLLIGGSGERRTLPLVARVADIWNGEGDPAVYAHKSALLDELCRQQGRPGGSIRRTVGLPPPLIRAGSGRGRPRAEPPPDTARVSARGSPGGQPGVAPRGQRPIRDRPAARVPRGGRRGGHLRLAGPGR